MANEAVIIDLGSNGGAPYQYTCADGTAISKGTLLKLSDPRTVSASSADSDTFAGIAAVDKVANDGQTTIPVYTEGIFDLKCNGVNSITAGQLVSLSGANLIKTATEAEVVTGDVIGKALETAAVDEAIAVKLTLN